MALRFEWNTLQPVGFDTFHKPHRLKSVPLTPAHPFHPISRKFRIESHSTEIRREDKNAMPEFNLESYLEHSKKVDASDMDFSEAPRYPLSEE